MRHKISSRVIVNVISCLVVLAVAGVWTAEELISSGVRSATARAQADHSGDRVMALIAYVDSAEHPLQDRNRAVWALGQIGDERARPVLERYYDGRACDHGSRLCQHELRKAIALVSKSH